MNLSTSLLFLHGHIADPRLGVELAASAAAPRATAPVSRRPTMDLFKSVMYLGGRPMHPGHNFDLEEPFEPEFGNRVAFARVFGRTVPAPQPQQRAQAPRTATRPRPVRAAVLGCG